MTFSFKYIEDFDFNFLSLNFASLSSLPNDLIFLIKKSFVLLNFSINFSFCLNFSPSLVPPLYFIYLLYTFLKKVNRKKEDF